MTTAHPPAAGRPRGTTPEGTPGRRTAKTADQLLREARAALPRRPSPAEAHAAQAQGALLIDIRGDDQRRVGGLIPGALVLPRNALEWRCDPAGRWRHPAMTGRNQRLILIARKDSSPASRRRPCTNSASPTPPTSTAASPHGPQPGSR